MVKYFQMEMIVCYFFGVMSQHFFHNFVGNKMITVGIFGFIDSYLRFVSDGFEPRAGLNLFQTVPAPAQLGLLSPKYPSLSEARQGSTF